ncbi:MAG: DNA polymerase III subunit gamma/tau, partial [Actinomycetota bacterium]
GALLDDAIDAIAARDLGALLKTIDRLIESGHDPRRFAQDLLERLRDLVIADAVDDGLKMILRNYPDDQLERMRAQSARMGGANLSRAAAIVAEGLNQMRGATAPRLILELIVSRIVITGGDGSDQGAIARIERLERQLSMEPMPTKSAPSKPVKEAPKAAPVTTAAPVKEIKEKPAPSSSPKPNAQNAGNLDVTALRRMWPEVIESVKKKRRLTWSLLSASAQILSVDEHHITIGIVNAGARDSFIRSESEPILSDAFVEVTGMRRKIEVVVDPSVDPYSPANMGKRTDEDPSDANQLAGTELIMKELGAQVIAESEK